MMNKAKIEACERLCREFLKRVKAVEAKAANLSAMLNGFGGAWKQVRFAVSAWN